MLLIVKRPHLMFLLMLLKLGSSAKREAVVVRGTTVPPGFSRPTGQLMEFCPSDYPFPYHDGKRCCKHLFKDPNTDPSPDCDGGSLKWESHPSCCHLQEYVECTDQQKRCKLAKGVDYMAYFCPHNPSPTIAFADPSFDEARYPANKILYTNECEEKTPESKIDYQLFTDDATNQKIVIDLGCFRAIWQFTLKNTRNAHQGKRGTKDFRLEISEDNENWVTVMEDTLASVVTEPQCNIPKIDFDVFAQGRYIRFTAISYYENGAGLNYIDWKILNS